MYAHKNNLLKSVENVLSHYKVENCNSGCRIFIFILKLFYNQNKCLSKYRVFISNADYIRKLLL